MKYRTKSEVLFVANVVAAPDASVIVVVVIVADASVVVVVIEVIVLKPENLTLYVSRLLNSFKFKIHNP